MTDKDHIPISQLVQIENLGGKKTVATTTVSISKNMGKRHDNVIQKLKVLLDSAVFSLLNFKESKYVDDRGKDHRKVMKIANDLIND